MNTQEKYNFLFLALSLMLLVFNVIFLKNAAEEILYNHALAGTLDTKYLLSEGWYFDYSTINAHYVITAVFIVLFYLFRFIIKKNSINIIFIVMYLIAEIIVIVIFPVLGFLIGLQTGIFVLFAAINLLIK